MAVARGRSSSNQILSTLNLYSFERSTSFPVTPSTVKSTLAKCNNYEPLRVREL